MIRLEGASVVFHPGTVNENTALRRVDLDVRQGDFITIIGSNGAGKSTLFNLIGGSLRAAEGAVRHHDRPITRLPEYKRARFIGRIFQDPMLGTASNMTIEENLILAYRKGFKGLTISLNKRRRREFRDRLAQLDMGLEDRLHDTVGLLSGGQRQALTLLMTVMSRPDLILLDEHAAALDPKNADLVLDLTRRFIADQRLTAMMITHNMHHAIHTGNRLLMMDKGEIIFDVRGAEKDALTADGLVAKFHEIRHEALDSDEVLLS